jgi:D-arabinitol dehydrogenase (NADP+)
MMKAVRYEAATQFRIVEIDQPEPRPGDVVIKVAQAGLCGTDLHLHHGDFGAVFPLIPGHEVVGTVQAVGSGATRFAVGEQVTINPNVHCGHCQYCRAGRLILCENARAFGVSEPGFFAEYACVPEVQVFSVSGLSSDTAVFAEPTACAMHGLETLQVRPGSSALVLGAGPTGLLLAQLLATGGASSVTVAGPTRFKLETAAALGADRTVLIDRTDVGGNVSALRRQSPSGDGYDIVIEATGATAVGDICVPLTRNGGTVLVYGVTRADEALRISPFDVFRREITIKGSFAEMTSFGAAITALRGGRVRTDGIITHRIPLVEYAAALDALRSDPTAHKVVLVT